MRNLDWDGLRNVRDLGGLATRLSPTGTTIMGRVARGPRRELLTSAGWIAAARWGLRSIVDLRSADETGPRDADPAAPPPADLTITLAPTEDQTHPEFRAVCLPILDSPEYWQHNVRILPELIRQTLEAIASSEPGVLVHCAAGRDRTGMISALLLANAGVSSDDIIADYAESVYAMAGAAPHGSPTHDRQASWTREQTTAWLGTVTPHVRAFVADRGAVLDALDVSAQTRKTMRELLIA
ncbi:tyrosine-protein phosphatase [Gryllotalpicola reticulitermitis]|uniref:Tyrosine-protein phosphatase n=1 Tax=Gryllotalpicola reticulitermitis TaxID=1184153 RepID=A0ABV8Q7P2_9MICO